MIPRYSSERISQIFSDDNKFKKWLEIEKYLLKFLAEKDKFSKKNAEILCNSLSINKDEVYEEEQKTKHDVVAFVNAVCKKTLLIEKKWIHYGITSSDIVDTANSLLLKEANDYLFSLIFELRKVLKHLALKHKALISYDGKQIISLGYKFATCYAHLNELLESFSDIRPYIECASISGAVGTCAHVTPDCQEYISQKLNLFSSKASTQVLSRERYSSYFSILASIGTLISDLALDLRQLTRTEIGELSETFGTRQIGSSCMPHKRNPITLENICGLARLLKGYAYSASLNTSIWLERDISHSSVDRVVFLDAITIMALILKKSTSTLRNIVFNEENIRRNLEKAKELVFVETAQQVLLEKTNFSRVQIEHWLEEILVVCKEHNASFEDMFRTSELPKYINAEDLRNIFDLESRVKYVDILYSRIFEEEGMKDNFKKIYFEKEEVELAIARLASLLNGEYRSGEEVILVGIMEGAYLFLEKLLGMLKFKINLKLLSMRDANGDIRRKVGNVGSARILIVDELVDTGTTIGFFKQTLEPMRPIDIKVCTLFTKQKVSVDFYGLELPSGNWAGYGMDIENSYRNMEFVGEPN
ncbi:hypothetical protein A6V39_01930 [Candidatus Mycoplasma haematobovis]|uniref:Adenylosuccinate lyase n=1 Tax=Candidatus Mycoplasma haematobovis TaxID=432608 RepID=A0A1A9QER6_9MOLU|nr:adenylosuccinate lyase [Candidatus Mycoplasma haematobovis]OAL10189.1 hypothetical protein A6V39_01930 [Candidatus Mycoplasma haematobovis]